MTLRNDPLLQERGRAEAVRCVAIAVVLWWWALWYIVILAGLRLPTVLLVWCFYFSCSCMFLLFFYLVPVLPPFVFALIGALRHSCILINPWDWDRRPGFSICWPAVFRSFSGPPKGGTSPLQLRNALAACPACLGTLE